MNWGLLGFAMCYSRKEVTSLPVSFNTVTRKMSGSSRYCYTAIDNGLFLSAQMCECECTSMAVSVQISIRWWSTWRQKSLFWTDNPSNPSSSSFSGWETLFFICWSTFLTRWAQLDDIHQLSRCCQICCFMTEYLCRAPSCVQGLGSCGTVRL